MLRSHSRLGQPACLSRISRPGFAHLKALRCHPSAVVVHASASPSGRQTEVQTALGGLKQAIKYGASADPAYANGSAYLKTIGFTSAAEIARVLDVAMNPNSLFVSYNDVKRSKNANARSLDVEKDMRPVVDFLTERRVPVGEIVRIISQHPPVLSYSVPQRLQPFWQYLESIGVPDVAAAVIARPSLLGLDVDRNLRKIVDYLQYIETPIDLVIEYLQRSI